MIGERLQELRKDKGVSQADLADLLGVSSNTISSYECNRSDPDDHLKVILAKFFNVSLDYLLGLTDTQYSFQRGKNIVLVPDSFSDKDIAEVKEYIAYITYKNKNSM
ncbi:MAG: helix-turn-helix transcriptional regulator [Ruminococcus sp.]|nr:helix-turn-helix transcriptional regulator [Ruminococcus sp.]